MRFVLVCLLLLVTSGIAGAEEAQSRNAQEIARRGAELYDKLAAFVGDLERVGKSLDTATPARKIEHKHKKIKTLKCCFGRMKYFALFISPTVNLRRESETRERN